MSARRAQGKASPLSEIARLFVRFDLIARLIANANHSIM
jgi:hypothetical protein